MASFILYIFTLLCMVAAACVGMDFSPSFTAMFLVMFLALIVLGEACSHFRETKHARMLSFLRYPLSAIGAFLVAVSVFIYAFGDDWLRIWVGLALIASVIGHFTVCFLLYRKQGRKMDIGAGLENWMLLAAGFFTLACAVSSTALWPYGFGVLLILTARRLGDIKADGLLSRGLMVLGMLLCAVFLVAPMVF